VNFKKMLAATGIATMASVVAFGGTAFAAGINGTGTVSCTGVTGTISFSPPLVSGGTSTKETIKVKAVETTCSGTGTNGGDVTSVKAAGSSKRSGANQNDCNNLATPSSQPLTLKAAYKVTKGKPKLNKSVITFTSTSGGVDGSGNAFFDASGTVTSGSFNGGTATTHVVIQESLATIGAQCGGAGVTTLHIASGNGSL
jgi:hypothetical protein